MTGTRTSSGSTDATRLLIVHAGTLFPIFVPDIRISDVRPIGPRIVDLLIAALLEEQLPVDALRPPRPG